MPAVQLRLTWSDAKPDLKFLGLSFLDNRSRGERAAAEPRGMGKNHRNPGEITTQLPARGRLVQPHIAFDGARPLVERPQPA